MLEFFSASARIVNSRRAVMECMEIALGDDYSDVDLIVLHASIGHQFQELMDQAKTMAPQATILAASCCGVVGREGVSESMKDLALMAVKGKEFGYSFTNNFYGHNAFEKTKAMALELKKSTPGVNMLYFLGSGIDTDNQAVIRACEEVFGDGVTIFWCHFFR